jgi:ABC-2 type transport system ATP-binding protein
MRPTEYRPRIQELLERFGPWDRRRDVVGSWSRGMKQKLAVARAVLCRPRWCSSTSPAGLDPVASASLRDDLARLAAMVAQRSSHHTTSVKPSGCAMSWG